MMSTEAVSWAIDYMRDQPTYFLVDGLKHGRLSLGAELSLEGRKT